MKKHLLIAAGLIVAVTGFALPSGSAQASWAESAQGNPVYTGTNRSLWRSERAQRHFSYRSSRRYAYPGYSAYGAYNGRGYMGGYYGY